MSYLINQIDGPPFVLALALGWRPNDVLALFGKQLELLWTVNVCVWFLHLNDHVTLSCLISAHFVSYLYCKLSCMLPKMNVFISSAESL